MNLKVIENQLIPVYENDQNEHLVNARELHEFIGSKQDFTDWIKNRIEKYEFTEEIDFTIILGKSTGGRPSTEYILKIDTAKEIAMVENNNKGRIVRKYFIELEKRLNNYSNLSPELKMFKAIFDSVAQQQLKLTSMETKLDVMTSNLLQEHKDDWREYINKVLKGIGNKTNDYRTPRIGTYNELEKRAKCNLKARLNHLRSRAVDNDKSLTYIQNLNYLDILEDESRLREIYLGIIREYAIKHEIEVA